MPRLAICSRDLHWQWINWAPLYDTVEVSMLRLTWLTVAQHVFQPTLTGTLELISRKIGSCEPGTKAIAVSRFREKLSPANWVQGVTAISQKYHALGRQKMGSNMRPRYTRPRYIGLTLYMVLTHWGWWRIYASVQHANIGSDNGLSPGRRQTIIWTNAGILWVQTLGTNLKMY